LQTVAAEQLDSSDDTQQKAIQLHFEGKTLEAISVLDEFYRETTGEKSIREQRNLVLLILDICETIAHFECTLSYADTLSELVDPEASTLQKQVDLQWNIYYRLVNSFVFDDKTQYLEFFDTGWLDKLRPLPRPMLYVRAHIVGARIYIIEGRIKEARIFLDRAIAVLVNFRGRFSFDVARNLRDLMGLLVATGDSTRAYGLYLVGVEFALESLAHSYPDLLLFRMAEAEVIRLENSPKGSLKAFELSKELLKLVQVKPVVKEYYLREIELNIAALCVLSDNLECAKDALTAYPGASAMENIVVNGRFTSSQSLEYGTALSLINSLTREEIPSYIARAFEGGLPKSQNESHRLTLESYRHFGKAMSDKDEEGNPNKEELLAAGQMRVRLYQSINRLNGDGFLLPNVLDRFILQSALIGISRKSAVSREEGDLALSLFELANRTLRHSEVEALAALAATDNRADKRVIHTQLRLASRQYQTERERLVELVEFFSKAPVEAPSEPPTIFDYQGYRQLATFGQMRQRMEETLSRNKAVNRKRWAHPTISKLQDILGDDEAFLAVTSALDRVVQICVTKERVFIGWRSFVRQSALLDFKLLLAALTARHQPSESLDSQFPLLASARLYDLLIGSVDECLEDVSHIVWSPNAGLLALPLGVLHKKKDAEEQNSNDLSSVPWLARRYSITNTPSARGFIAARRLAQSSSNAGGFLGVGDPLLSGKTFDGQTRSASLITRSAQGDEGVLNTLPDLPETSEELEFILKSFEGRGKLILKEKATEANFRREVVKPYSVVAFATHGLIQEEIEGLVEPALVLTPQFGSYELDDGLLTASEIANLNLNARLVVLSACNTANFRADLIGTEVQSFTTAFAIAGTPATFATLWPVESQTSKQVVSNMFEHMFANGGETPATALKKAINQFIDDPPGVAFLHPRFWSPFVIFGDGNTEISSNQAKLENWEIAYIHTDEESRGGEILGAAKDDRSSDIYLTGLYRPKKGFHSSYLIKVGTQGKIEWISEEVMTGASSAVTVLDDGVVVGGYVALEDGTYSPILRKVLRDGAEVWRARFPVEGKNAFPFGVVRIPGEETIVLGVTSRVWGEEEDTDLEVELIKIDARTGLEIARKSMPSSFSSEWVTSLAIGDGRLVLVEANRYRRVSERTPEQHYNSYGILDTCTEDARSVIRVFETDNFELLNITTHDGIVIRGVVGSEGKEFLGAATRREYCIGGFPMVVRISLDGVVSVVFEDSEPFDSQGNDVAIGRDGRIILAGSSQRIFDIELGISRDLAYFQDMEKWSDDRDVASRRRGNYSFYDAFITEIDRAGKVISRRWIQTGADVYISKILTTPDGALLTGRVGDQSMWSKLTPMGGDLAQ
jgi:CHAT domain-containing protein